MNDIMKIAKSLEDSGLLIKVISKTIKVEAKEQKDRFLSRLLGTLGASLLGNMLAGKRVTRRHEGVTRVGEGTIRILMSPHPFSNSEIHKFNTTFKFRY